MSSYSTCYDDFVINNDLRDRDDSELINVLVAALNQVTSSDVLKELNDEHIDSLKKKVLFMPRRFEKINDQELTALVKDGLDWESTGVLPNGILRIEADRYIDLYPTMDVSSSRKICRDEAFREATVRWMETQGFKV